MAKADVELIIKARDEATQAVNTIVDALNDLRGSQRGVEGSSAGMDNALQRAGRGIQALSDEIKQLRELERAARSIEKMEKALDKLNASSEKAEAKLSELENEARAAGEPMDRLARDVQKAEKAFLEKRQASEAASQELRTARNAANRAANGYAKLQERIDKAKKPSDKLKASLAEQKAVLDKANAALTEAVAREERASSARKESAAELKSAQSALRGAEKNQDRLTQSVEKQRAAVQQANAELSEAREILQRTRQSVEGASASFEGLELDSRELGEQIGRATRRMRELEKVQVAERMRVTSGAMQRGARNARGMRDAFKELYGEGRQAMSFMQRMRGEVLSLAAAYFGLYEAMNQIGQITNTIRVVDAAQNRLGVVFERNSEAIRQEMEWLLGEAERLGVEFGVLSDEYSKFAVTASRSGFEMSAVREIFISVSEAARVNKLSLDQVRGVYMALQQMIQKGRVQSEELRRQLGDRLPAAFELFSQAVGVSTAELGEMMERGEVIADQETLTSFARVLQDQFGAQLPDALRATTTQMDRFKNAVFEARMTIAQGGFGDALGESLGEINEMLGSTEARQFFLGISEVLANLTRMLPGLIQSLDLLIKGFMALVAIRMARFFMSIGDAMRPTRAQLRLAVGDFQALRLHLVSLHAQLGAGFSQNQRFARSLRAMRGAAVATSMAFRSLMAAVGGLTGLLTAIGIYVVGELLARWMTKTNEIVRLVGEHEEAMQEVARAYREAAGDVRQFRLELERTTVSEMSARRIRARDELGSVRARLGDAGVNAAMAVFHEENEATAQGLAALVQAARTGEISMQEFIAAVDEMQQVTEGFSPELAEGLIQIAREGADAETIIRETTAAMQLLQDPSNEAARAILGLGEAAEEAGDQFDPTTVDTYREALDDLREAIPSLAMELEHLNNVAEIEDAFARGVEAVGPVTSGAQFDRLQELRQLRDRAMREERERYDQAVAQAERNSPEGKRREALQEYRAEFAQYLSDLDFEIEQQGRSAREQAVQAALRDRTLAAQEAGVELSRQELQNIENQVGALWDLENAERQRNERRQQVEQRVNNLLEMRRILMEQLELQQTEGNLGAVDALRDRIEDINVTLEEAIERAIAFFEAMGGPEAELAIERLRLMQASLEDVKEEALITGEQIARAMAQHGAQAFDSLAEAIANGEASLKNIGDIFRQFAADFLRQIAQMIIQQLIFNMVQSMMGGFSVPMPKMPSVPVMHSGGIVGQPGASRPVLGSWFRGAARYATGGIAGLKPDEVPAILHRGEEVLTQGDPRHRGNGGGAAPVVKVINTLDPGEFVSKGLDTPAGEKAILNFMRANSQTIRGALS